MEKTTKTTTKPAWTPNDKQKAFMELLDKEHGKTLKDIEIDNGVAYATGTINTLIAKGLVIATDTEITYEKYYRGVKVGEERKTVKAYTLA